MTSNDTPTPPPGRRRALGRGPGAAPATPRPAPSPDPATTPTETREPVSPLMHQAPVGAGAGAGGGGLEDSPEPEADGAGSQPEAGVVVEPREPEGAARPGAVERAEARVVVAGPPAAVEAEAGAGSRAESPGGSSAVGSAADGGASGAGSAGEPDGGAAPGGDTAPDGNAVPDGDGVFKVRLANFEGPFDLLLQLISRHKLDVTEVALSKVTDEFMAYIRAMGADWDLDETTEFLVVAATLLDLKAARLLPAAEVEDEADLALLEARDLLFARLLQYRAYKQIAEIFNRRLDEEARRYPRTVGLEPHHAELLPEVVISIGPDRFAQLAVKAMQPRPRPQVYVDHIHAPLVSVQEQAAIVVARVRELGEVSFRTLVEDTDDTLTVVARFLALLELYREKAVALDQEIALGELTVRWTGGDGDETPTVTGEFDRPPEEPKGPEERSGKQQGSQEETA
ncbi:segregation and condensation protein A [Streptomyces sp. YIM S03343]